MKKYEGVDCPICHKPLENGEPLAICPDCGAPYHKHCVEQTGECLYSELHREGKSWEAPKTSANYTDDNPRRCTRCGTLNPVGSSFCVVCGNHLEQPEDYHAETAEPVGMNPYPSPYGMGGMFPPNVGQPNGEQPPQMPYNPLMNPFGGVNPDADIDDIPAKDWAIFVGSNTPYFLPKFQAYADKNRKVVTFNFAAMFFRGFYFLYRKMYLWGLLLILVEVLFTLPYSFLVTNSMLKEAYGITLMNFNEGMMNTLSMAGMALVFLIRLGCGFFANKLYMIHGKKKIQTIKALSPDDASYHQTLQVKGSVARELAICLLIAYFAMMVLSMFVGG